MEVFGFFILLVYSVLHIHPLETIHVCAEHVCVHMNSRRRMEVLGHLKHGISHVNILVMHGVIHVYGCMYVCTCNIMQVKWQ